MTAPPATPDVCEALRVEIAGFRTLHRILEAEADALRRADPDALRAQEAWKTLAALAIEAKRQNEINGRLAARQRWHFDAALGALLQAAGVQSVYGADGRPRRQDAPQTRFAV
jgi:flagellar biosynthesis/type III secretory pathway chaperone